MKSFLLARRCKCSALTHHATPFAPSPAPSSSPQALVENIAGDRKETSPYDVTFGDQVPWRQLCDVTLTPDQVKAFKDAVHQDYFFEFFVEDLPMWGYVGEIVGEDLLLGEVSF